MVSASLLLATASSAAAQADGGWRRIFDGRTLAGWTPKVTGYGLGEDPFRFFTVADGAIRVSYGRYPRFTGAFGHLFYRSPFAAYRVRFEYRFRGIALPGVADWQHSNSGMMLHAQAPETVVRDQQFPVSLELQLLGSNRPTREPTGNLCTPGVTVVIAGQVDRRHCILSASPIMPQRRWVRAEAELTRDGRVTHFIEGKPVLQYSDPRYDPADSDARPLIAATGGALALRSGYIALQAEGHPVEFRNIEVRELR